MNTIIIAVLLLLAFCTTPLRVVCLAAEFENPLDDLHFKYSEKYIQECIQKAANTRQTRIEHAFSNATTVGLREGFVLYFADLWLGRNLDQVNEALLDIFTTNNPEKRQKYRLNDYWDLAVNQQFYHMYYAA